MQINRKELFPHGFLNCDLGGDRNSMGLVVGHKGAFELAVLPYDLAGSLIPRQNKNGFAEGLGLLPKGLLTGNLGGNRGGGGLVIEHEGAPELAVLLPQRIRDVHNQPMVQQHQLRLLPLAAKPAVPEPCTDRTTPVIFWERGISCEHMRVNKTRFRTEDGPGMALAFGQQGGCLHVRLQQEKRVAFTLQWPM
jgi:hypothetical protein